LSDAIESDAVERETNGTEDFLFVAHPIGEIVISHTFSDGFDTVEISSVSVIRKGSFCPFQKATGA
jgi:hypothetical protein